MKTALSVLLFVLSASALADPIYSVGDFAESYIGETLQLDGSTAQEDLLARNEKYLLVESFKIACGPCRVNFPIVAEFASRKSGKLAVKYLTGRDTVADLKVFFAEHPGWQNGGVLADLFKELPPGTVKRPEGFNTPFVPTSFLIGPDRKILWVHVGVFEEEDLAALSALIEL